RTSLRPVVDRKNEFLFPATSKHHGAGMTARFNGSASSTSTSTSAGGREDEQRDDRPSSSLLEQIQALLAWQQPRSFATTSTTPIPRQSWEVTTEVFEQGQPGYSRHPTGENKGEKVVVPLQKIDLLVEDVLVSRTATRNRTTSDYTAGTGNLHPRRRQQDHADLLDGAVEAGAERSKHDDAFDLLRTKLLTMLQKQIWQSSFRL
ncbi:unnamed protein product, partial [Amoebophrya sp. A120]